MKLTFATLLLVSLVLSSVFLQSMAQADSSFCNTECGRRCAEAGDNKRCSDLCKICCKKCNCVSKGTYGNRSDCPCYGGMLNSKGTTKCP